MAKIGDMIWHNGKLVPWQNATVHVLTHALHYGSSVFEGIRAYHTPSGTKIMALKAHMRRLYDSARIYRIEVPYDIETLSAACKEVLRLAQMKSGYLRPLIYRGFGNNIGLVPTKNTPTEVAIAAIEWGTYLGEGALEKGVTTAVSSWTRLAPNTMPTLAKAGGNYLSSQLMGLEAKRNGYDEAIALDVNGYVSEGPGENIFLVKDGVLYTPPLTASILEGITRDAVITLARDSGITVREENIAREMLYTADELFFTGTAAEISPIRSVDGITVGSGARGPMTHRLQSQFFGLFSGETEDKWGWLEGIEA